jgi:flagellar basal body rod protein FlgG
MWRVYFDGISNGNPVKLKTAGGHYLFSSVMGSFCQDRVGWFRLGHTSTLILPAGSYVCGYIQFTFGVNDERQPVSGKHAGVSQHKKGAGVLVVQLEIVAFKMQSGRSQQILHGGQTLTIILFHLGKTGYC